MTTINTIGVIGAGQMGGGIAHVFSLAGYDVALNDVAEGPRTRRSASSSGTWLARRTRAR